MACTAAEAAPSPGARRRRQLQALVRRRVKEVRVSGAWACYRREPAQHEESTRAETPGVDQPNRALSLRPTAPAPGLSQHCRIRSVSVPREGNHPRPPSTRNSLIRGARSHRALRGLRRPTHPLHYRPPEVLRCVSNQGPARFARTSQRWGLRARIGTSGNIELLRVRRLVQRRRCQSGGDGRPPIEDRHRPLGHQ